MNEKDIERIIDRRLKQVLGRAKDCLETESRTLDVDWGEIPEQYQWVAQDADGDLYAYTDRPCSHIHPRWWMSEVGDLQCVRADQPEEPVSNWKDTLVRRPEPGSDETNLQTAPAPHINWDTLPDWARYAAVDCDGSLWLYEDRPYTSGGRWRMRDDSNKRVKMADTAAYPRTARAWKDSLVERPEPAVDWDKIPVWCDWVAMGKDERWFAYAVEPRRRGGLSDRWSVDGDIPSHNLVCLPPSLSPTHNGLAWAQTLCRRPGTGQ